MHENSKTDNCYLKEKWLGQLQALWPAIKGSLAQVHKPCIRKNCRACASGKKHPAWILSVVAEGRRTTLYVPEGLVSQIRLAIKQGRKIEELLQKAAVQMIKNQRREVKKAKNPPLKS
jgi:hypothetical protein